MTKILDQLFEAIPQLHDFHAPTDPAYGLLRMVARREIEGMFAAVEAAPQALGPFGELTFPYEKMGAIDSLDLFGIDELVIFAFYWANRGRYKNVLDLGANIGLHSIIMSRAAFNVTCFEPDPRHWDWLNRNLKLNDARTVTPVNAAVSTEKGTMDFVRVLGNTTGSHIAGAKSNVYGGTDVFPVAVEAFAEVIKGKDFMKMDVEGHEAAILVTTDAGTWKNFDAMIEVGTQKNAQIIFDHFQKIGVKLYAQKSSWKKVEKLGDMPTSHRNGSLFISSKTGVPWG
jgi:FkbM family methyltransferase